MKEVKTLVFLVIYFCFNTISRADNVSDQLRIVELKSIQTALEKYYAAHGSYLLSNAGSGGQGYVGHKYSGKQSIIEVLREKGLLDQMSVSNSQKQNYMLYLCDNGKRYALSATLDQATPAQISMTKKSCNGEGPNGTYSRYGKNYVLTGGGIINVKEFGAKGDGQSDDSNAISDAIEYVRRFGGAKTIYFPAGKYRITRPIRPEVNNLTLLGDDNKTVILDDGISGMAITVSKSGTSRCSTDTCFMKSFTFPDDSKITSVRLEYVRGIALKNFNIQATNKKFKPSGREADSVPVIAMNAAPDMLIDNVNIIGNTTLKGMNENGIATSQGTTGVIQNLSIDMVSKPGIYISSWSRDILVKNVIVKNTQVGPNNNPSYGVGFSSVGDNVVFEDSKAINNSGGGFVIHPIGIIDQNRTGLMGKGTVIKNCISEGNASGFMIDSAYQNVPENVELSNIKAIRNKSYGLKASAGSNIQVTVAEFSNNGNAGILLDDTSHLIPGQRAPEKFKFTDISLVDNVMSVRAKIGAIGIRGDVDAELSDITIKTQHPDSRQSYGIFFFKHQNETKKNVIKNMTILDEKTLRVGKEN